MNGADTMERTRDALRWGRTTFGRMTSTVRLTPSFVILGAQRSGTTSLYNDLIAHPCVLPGRKKEIHFFDLNFDRGMSWYRGHFPSMVARAAHSLRDDVCVTGEASPYYLFHPYVPERLSRLLPDARLIAILRNPVDRAISHYHHERRKGREPLSLVEALRREDERLAEARRAIRRGLRFDERIYQQCSYAARGRYDEQIERWLAYVPGERLLVLSSEEYFREPARTYRRILCFLDLPLREPSRWARLNGGSRPGCDETVRAELMESFRGHNERLYERIGRDLGWSRNPR